MRGERAYTSSDVSFTASGGVRTDPLAALHTSVTEAMNNV